MAKRAMFRVSDELLISVLGLPADTLIFHCEHGLNHEVLFAVEQNDLQDVQLAECQTYPMLSPQFVKGDDGKPKFIGWGQ